VVRRDGAGVPAAPGCRRGNSYPERSVDSGALARDIVAIVEGSIMLTRTQEDRPMMARHFDFLKEHLKTVALRSWLIGKEIMDPIRHMRRVASIA